MRSLQLSFFTIHDGSDKTNRITGFWTPVFLVCISVITFALPIVQNPVNCWTPEEMTPQQTEYMNWNCWEKGNLYHLMQDEVPRMSAQRISAIPRYHVWLPIIFIGQALLFLIPNIVWNSLKSCTGMNKNKVYGMTEGYGNLSLQDRKGVSVQLAKYLNQWIKGNLIQGCPWGIHTLFTAFIKLSYFSIVSVQFAVFDKLLKSDNVPNFGSELLVRLLYSNKTDLMEMTKFPKSVLCDVKIRQLATVSQYTLQCHLQMNIYYEMICVVVWILLCFVLILNVSSCIFYAIQTVPPVFRTRFVKRHLLAGSCLPVPPNDNEISNFANSFLGQDGMTVLHWIGKVSSSLLLVDTIEQMWFIHHSQGLQVMTVYLDPSQQPGPQSQPPEPRPQQGHLSTDPLLPGPTSSAVQGGARVPDPPASYNPMAHDMKSTTHT